MTSNLDVELSIVVPIYNNETSITSLINELNSICAKFNFNVEVVFVIDGSPDGSVALIQKNADQIVFSHTVIELSKNYGAFSAIKCGIENSNGKYIAVKTADLQEPSDLIYKFYNMLTENKSDIVFGLRISRNDGFVSNFFSKLFWRIYKKYVNNQVPIGGTDVFACTNQVAASIKNLNERNTSLLGLLYWVGYSRGYVEYERLERKSGKSSWSFRKKIRYASDSIFSFTDLPIIAIQIIGVVGISISLLISILVVILKLSGSLLVPGYAALMLVILFSTSALLFAIGIVGNYSWRAFENSKNRPNVIVMKKY